MGLELKPVKMSILFSNTFLGVCSLLVYCDLNVLYFYSFINPIPVPNIAIVMAKKSMNQLSVVNKNRSDMIKNDPLNPTREEIKQIFINLFLGPNWPSVMWPHLNAVRFTRAKRTNPAVACCAKGDGKTKGDKIERTTNKIKTQYFFIFSSLFGYFTSAFIRFSYVFKFLFNRLWVWSKSK